MKQFSEPIYVASENGKERVLLNYNEPRPDLAVRSIPSRMVKLDQASHPLTRLRLEVEDILHRGCANSQLALLPRMGPDVGTILLKIARSGQSGNSCCDNCFHRAVAAMRYFPQARVQEWLITALNDPKASVGLRAQAILSLGYVNSSASEKILFELLKNDPDEAIRKAAAYSLNQNVKPEHFKTLTDLVKKEKSSGVLQQLVYTARSISSQYNLPLPDKFPELSAMKIQGKPVPISPIIKSKK